MTINNNDGIILLSCPLHTLICSDSQLCSFINSPSAVISDGEVRQQNLHVPSLTIFFSWIISVFSFVNLWDGSEEKTWVREGANVLFDMWAYHTEQHCRTVLSLVILFHLPFSCLFSRRINTLRNCKSKTHPWLFFLFLKSQNPVFAQGEEEELNGSFSNPCDNAWAHFGAWFMPVTNRLPGSWWLK